MSAKESGDVRKSEDATASVGDQKPRAGSIPAGAHSVERLSNACRVMHSLLNDPHPGLFTWLQMYDNSMRELREAVEAMTREDA